MERNYLSLLHVPMSRADFTNRFLCSMTWVMSFEPINTKFGFVGGVGVDDRWLRVVWLHDMLNVVCSPISGEQVIQAFVSAHIASGSSLNRQVPRCCPSRSGVSCITSDSWLLSRG